MALITKKKLSYPVGDQLMGFLRDFGRAQVAVKYSDLERYTSSIPLMDRNGSDTLWETVFFPQTEMVHLHEDLKKVYSNLKADGDVSVIKHLFIDRIDLCPFGNTRPYRIRIVNRINDNFDYFYVKVADASRVYGLELEHLLSPNRINYFVDGQTLIEEHIAGVPGDQFFKNYIDDPNMNKIRLAKEFVKFNERCFYRLLGDMHSSNFVIVITPDFEEVSYRIRPIDFDQQSYEGRKAVYMPKYFKQNNPIIQTGIEVMTSESMFQYQLEEQSLMLSRARAAKFKLTQLLDVMCNDSIALPGNIKMLRKELADFHNEPKFLKCKNMGEILRMNLNMLGKD